MSDYDAATEQKLLKVIAEDPRYPREAYEFISEALAYTSRLFDQEGHVSGQQLCEGSRQLALERFGYLARTVLASWNVVATDDLGNLVYNMIGADLLRRAEGDSLDDFHDVYAFEEVFDRLFRIELETGD